MLLTLSSIGIARADAQLDRALALSERGDYAKARALAERVLDSGLIGDVYLDALDLRADAALSAGDADTESLLLRAIAERVRVKGERDPDALISLHNLAWLYDQQERHAEALATWLRVLALQEQALGVDHPETVETLLSLGLNRLNAGEPAAGERHVLRALVLAEGVAGAAWVADHARAELGLLYLEQGRPAALRPHLPWLLAQDPAGYAANDPELAELLGWFHEDLLALAHEIAPDQPEAVIAHWLDGDLYDYDAILDQVDTAIAQLQTGNWAEAEIGALTALDLLPLDDAFAVMVKSAFAYRLTAREGIARAEPWLRMLADLSETVFDRTATEVTAMLGRTKDARLGIAHNLNALARLYRERRQFHDAERVLDRAETLARRVEDGDGARALVLARIALTRGDLRIDQGRRAEASTTLEQAAARFAAGPWRDTAHHAAALRRLGNWQAHIGQTNEAETHLRRALAIDETDPETRPGDQAATLLGLARVYHARARTDLALPLAERARKLARAEPVNRPLLVDTLSQLAQSHAQAGEMAVALETWREAHTAARAYLPRHAIQRHAVAQALGLALTEAGAEDEVEHLFTGAEVVQDALIGQRASLDSFRIKRALDRAIAERNWPRAAEHARGLRAVRAELLGAAHPRTAEADATHGRIALQRGEIEEALNILRAATAVLGRPELRAHPAAQAAFAAHAQAAQRAAMARPVDERAPLLAEMFNAAQQAGTLRAGQALSRAAARWQADNAELAALVRELQDSEATIRALNDTLLGGLARGTADSGSLLAEVEALRIRADGLRARIETVYPRYAALAQQSPLGLPEAQAALGPDEALVLFVTADAPDTPDASAGLVVAVTAETIQAAALLPRAALVRAVTALRCSAALPDPRCQGVANATRGALGLSASGPSRSQPRFDVTAAHALYRRLLGPIEQVIADKSDLLIVPDRALIGLPFHLLISEAPSAATTPRDARWLIRNQALTVLPNTGALRALRDAGPSGADRPFLGVGDPLIGAQANGPLDHACDAVHRPTPVTSLGRVALARGAQADVARLRALDALPETRCELRRTAATLGAGEDALLLGSTAREARLKTLDQTGALARYRVLSFATHGLLAGEVGAHDAALVLTPPDRPSADDDGLLTAGEIAALKLDAEWVLLSACNTAAGDAASEEGLAGLATAFFYAGARGLLASYWPVYSDAAVRLTTTALSALMAAPERGRAQALRAAMLDLLNDPTSTSRQLHPAYWAPFALIGDNGLTAQR